MAAIGYFCYRGRNKAGIGQLIKDADHGVTSFATVKDFYNRRMSGWYNRGEIYVLYPNIYISQKIQELTGLPEKGKGLSFLRECFRRLKGWEEKQVIFHEFPEFEKLVQDCKRIISSRADIEQWKTHFRNITKGDAPSTAINRINKQNKIIVASAERGQNFLKNRPEELLTHKDLNNAVVRGESNGKICDMATNPFYTMKPSFEHMNSEAELLAAAEEVKREIKTPIKKTSTSRPVALY